ncbi:MAG: PHP domain-containing protein [Clostridia bacterium]|nr:PHP domain-containing protein [Clostridia bacterium]
MNRYYYDLHIHSCLSPCGDDDSTPNNIAGMATLCGLNIVALTDHNTCKNCPAFFEAAKSYGIIPIAGMELTTSEDIHVVCLFEHLSDALEFDKYVEDNRVKIKNKPEIFGKQTVLDKNDEPLCEVESLLINATNISVEDVCDVVASYNGICYPAHIDRDANGIIAVLGSLPDCGFKFYELHDGDRIDEFSERYGIPKERFIISSDAHYLTDMRDKEAYLDIEDEPYSSSLVRSRLFELFKR